jgi:hypothetical protein
MNLSFRGRVFWKNSIVSLTLGFAIMFTAASPKHAEASSDEPVSELARMYKQDQTDRMELGPSPRADKWKKLAENDNLHHERVLELLKQDKIQSADDFYYAAMIMQHGSTPSDYTLAHILAMAAAQKGNKDAIWLSAASFDRLMLSAKQPQVFGTQFFSDRGAPLKLNEPCDSQLISDSVRKHFNVPTINENLERLKKLNDEKLFVPKND